jgi:aspartate/tyrosine/aromatic aminotransferase
VAKKKSVTAVDESPSAKVRKAKIQVDLSIFEDWQADDRESAVDWVVGAFADGDEERTVLMQLQETGWTAEQSRAICNLAKNKGA